MLSAPSGKDCGGSPLAKAHTSVPSSCGQEGGPCPWPSWSLVGPCQAVELLLHSVAREGTWCPPSSGRPPEHGNKAQVATVACGEWGAANSWAW